MNTRERFLEIFKNFNPSVPSLKWEFAYWGETLNNWYNDGLPKKNPAIIPTNCTTISSSIYTRAWTCSNPHVKENEYPTGYAVSGGAIYTPTQGFVQDNDVKDFFGMDTGQEVVDLNLFFYPLFDIEVLEEDDDTLKYRDLDGVIRIFLKESATIPSGWEWPIRDRRSWEQLKEERLSLNRVRDRLPADWANKVKEYRNRDFPLGIGGYPLGFFGTLAHLIGYEGLFYMYYDDPALVHDIISTFTELWIAVFSEVLLEVELDHFQIWEDISFGSGSMVPLPIMKEFMFPYYKKTIDFLKQRGVDIFFVDTDGDCMDIIPFFIDAGVTAMYPFEAHCGMDIIKVRKKYPKLAMTGGIPKSEINRGKAHIDTLLEPVIEVLKTGGYVPHGDHFIPPDIDFENFTYYRQKLNTFIDGIS